MYLNWWMSSQVSKPVVVLSQGSLHPTDLEMLLLMQLWKVIFYHFFAIFFSSFLINPSAAQHLVKLNEVLSRQGLETVSRFRCSTRERRCIWNVSLSPIVIQVFIFAKPGLVFMRKCSWSWTKMSVTFFILILRCPSWEGFILWEEWRVKQSPTSPEKNWRSCLLVVNCINFLSDLSPIACPFTD